MTKRKTFVDEYMAEEFNFGGEILPRGEIIRRLKEIGGTPQQIDMYLFGLDFCKEMDEVIRAKLQKSLPRGGEIV